MALKLESVEPRGGGGPDVTPVRPWVNGVCQSLMVIEFVKEFYCKFRDVGALTSDTTLQKFQAIDAIGRIDNFNKIYQILLLTLVVWALFSVNFSSWL